jgi:hypothetical protein
MIDNVVPTIKRAQEYVQEAARLNPGAWVKHVEHAAEAARAIAERYPGLDPERAYVLGLLHDIGRRTGGKKIPHARHILDGYAFMLAEGFPAVARICMTHSFPAPIKDTAAFSSPWECPPEERRLVQDFLDRVEYDVYDRLIQLCDALAQTSGCCLIEKRLVEVALRHGVNELTVPKWRAYLDLRQQFDDAIGTSVYTVLPGIVENTFGFHQPDRE